jgi:hypothetical protein
MFKNLEELVSKLSSKNDIEATKELTKFFISSRFALPNEQFSQQYVDGKDDGGIDFFHTEDSTHIIVQSKFSGKMQHTDEQSVIHELNKIINTLQGQNPNKRANDFVNAVRRNLQDESMLEIIFLTTNKVQESVENTAQKHLEDIRKQNNWKIELDFVAFDKDALQRMIYDVAHGYIPYTGKKMLRTYGSYVENPGSNTGVYSIVCTTKITDILGWFENSLDVKRFLQKNIREYQGETKINRDIKTSFIGASNWFWYKHNGIIIFADSISKSHDLTQLILRNPQVVNGGQTLIAAFEAYDKGGRKESDAEVLVRVYRLPYEEAETYKKSIDIIKALNSQNAIRASDLHSTDPRQVRIEALLKEIGYTYWRRRGKDAKSARFAITMRNIALYYLVCKKRAPQEGVRGNVEEIFDEQSKYDDVFPEEAINRELSQNHIALSYVVVWRLAYLLNEFTSDLGKYTRELSSYTRYYALSDIYGKLLNWKTNAFDMTGWRNWKEFIESDEFKNGLWPYARRSFEAAAAIVPSKEEPRNYFKTKEAVQKFFTKLSSTRNFSSSMSKAFGLFKKEYNED